MASIQSRTKCTDMFCPLIKSSYRKTGYKWFTKYRESDELTYSTIEACPNLTKCMDISRYNSIRANNDIMSMRQMTISHRRNSVKEQTKYASNVYGRYSNEFKSLLKKWPNLETFPLLRKRAIASALINLAYESKIQSSHLKKPNNINIKLKEMFDKRQKRFNRNKERNTLDMYRIKIDNRLTTDGRMCNLINRP